MTQKKGKMKNQRPDLWFLSLKGCDNDWERVESFLTQYGWQLTPEILTNPANDWTKVSWSTLCLIRVYVGRELFRGEVKYYLYSLLYWWDWQFIDILGAVDEDLDVFLQIRMQSSYLQTSSIKELEEMRKTLSHGSYVRQTWQSNTPENS